MAGEVRVGTSGWQYDDWAGRFYPDDLDVDDWLGHYAASFPTVEVNATFYGLPDRDSVRGWRDAVGEDFEFAVKGSRFITHNKNLLDPQETVGNLLTPLEPLRERIAVMLWQLPPSWRRDAARLDAFLDAVPDDLRHAVEPRDDDWFHPETYEVLERHDAALVWLSSSLTEDDEPVRTAEHVYVRFHGLGEQAYRYSYADDELEAWAERLRDVAADGGQAWAFFNNDHEANAVADARTLVELLGDAARPP